MADPELVHEMISVVKFKYQSEDKREEIEISVQQIMEEDYALYVWPSAKVLAEYIWTHNVWNGKRILEVGVTLQLVLLLRLVRVLVFQD